MDVSSPRVRGQDCPRMEVGADDPQRVGGCEQAEDEAHSDHRSPELGGCSRRDQASQQVGLLVHVVTDDNRFRYRDAKTSSSSCGSHAEHCEESTRSEAAWPCKHYRSSELIVMRTE